MKLKGIQDYYADEFAQCYGCGRLNKEGHQIKTHWDGDETVSFYTPKKHHTAMEGFVYGGLLASLIDCHGTGSAALAYAKEQAIELTEFNAPRFVTGNLQVSYKKPTPIDGALELRGIIKEIKGRKVVTEIRLIAGGEVCVTGEVLAILIPENFGK
jgi:acyl-coenzyme A thioesterase PaaI-like protein